MAFRSRRLAPLVAVLPNYRLMPDMRFPAFVDDARYLTRHGTTPAILGGFVGLSGPYDFVFDTDLLK
jgi:hypothetical protein